MLSDRWSCFCFDLIFDFFRLHYFRNFHRKKFTELVVCAPRNLFIVRIAIFHILFVISCFWNWNLHFNFVVRFQSTLGSPNNLFLIKTFIVQKLWTWSWFCKFWVPSWVRIDVNMFEQVDISFQNSKLFLIIWCCNSRCAHSWPDN